MPVPGPIVTDSTNTQTQTQASLSAGQTNSTTGANTQGTGNVATANTYAPWQQALQQQAGGAVGSFIQSGNLPGTFGAPQQVFDAYSANYDRFVAPQIAAQGGAGAPAIASNKALGLQQLAGQVYQNQASNFSAGIGQAGNLGFSALGNSSNQSQQNSTDTTANGNWQQEMADLMRLASASSSTVTQFP
jgi:hypothetical protein